jgi:transcriptional regulator with XRE-family HTH domain
MDFGKRLKLVLIAKGISQKELAIRINVNESCVSNWVKGKRIPHIHQFLNLRQVLGLSVEELWYGTPLLDSLLEKYNESSN